MKSLTTLLFALLALSCFADDRQSWVYTGAGSTLVATYDSSDSTNVTSGNFCSPFERILVYLTVDSVGGSGAAINVFIEYSDDGTTFYPLMERVGNTDSTTTFEYEIDATGSYALPFPNAGKYFRVRASKVSGVSTAIRITDCEIEARS